MNNPEPQSNNVSTETRQDWRNEYFRISFERNGFTFDHDPIGDRVLIEWQSRQIVGVVWCAIYTPERGYYSIGVKRDNLRLSTIVPVPVSDELASIAAERLSDLTGVTSEAARLSRASR